MNTRLANPFNHPATGHRRPPHEWRGLRRGLALLCLMIPGLCGCRVTPPEQTLENTVHAREDVAATQQQIRLRMRALVEPLSGAIVESADRIMAGTTNRSVQRAALVWKIEAVPALREALFRPNPFVAAMDTWVLTLQMSDYFESGAGRAALGDAAPAAARTCQALSAEIETVAESMMISGNVSDIRAFARKWSSEHPIQHSIAGRESTLSRVTEREIQETFSTQELAGRAMETLDDLTRRMDVYSAQLFDQSRWQAELFAMDLADDYQLHQAVPLAQTAVRSAEEAVATLKRLEPSVQDSLAVTKSAPELIRSERAAAIEAVKAETALAREFIQKERLATLEYVSKEREVALKELSETLAGERQIVLTETERIAQKTVDHAMLRVAQLTAGILVCVLAGSLGLLLLARRLLVRKGS